jgi:hypothetical protein
MSMRGDQSHTGVRLPANEQTAAPVLETHDATRALAHVRLCMQVQVQQAEWTWEEEKHNAV